MDKPTKQEIKEFWEKYADNCESFNQDKHRHYRFGNEYYEDEPPIDLNNLFKYAVPKLKAVYPNWRVVLHAWVIELTGDCDKDTLALFWALDKVKEMKE